MAAMTIKSKNNVNLIKKPIHKGKLNKPSVLHSPYSDQEHAKFEAWAIDFYSKLPPAVNANGEKVKFIYKAYEEPAEIKQKNTIKKRVKQVRSSAVTI